MLLFVPFTFAVVLLLIVLLVIRDALSLAFIQMTAAGLGVFLLLFILSFFIIRKAYLKKIIE